MSATLVPAVKTSYNGQQMIEGFVKAWFKQFGELPKKEAIGVIWSQNAIETGSTTSMWNNNIGNIKYQPSKNSDDDNEIQYMMLSNVWEILEGKKVIFQPPDPATWFRSFATLEDGIAFHLDFLKNHRYKASWTAVESGNPAEFAHLLKINKYYTAPEADYVKAMNSYFKKFMADSTFDNVIKSLQPNLEIDESTDNVIITGDLDLAPAPKNNIWNTIIDVFKKQS